MQGRERWLALGVVVLAVIGVLAWQWPEITDQPRPLRASDRARLEADLATASAHADGIEARYAALIASQETLELQLRTQCPLTFSPPSEVDSAPWLHEDWVSVHEPGGASESVLAAQMRRAIGAIDPGGLFQTGTARTALDTAHELATRVQPDVAFVVVRLEENDGGFTLGGTVFLFDETTVCGSRVVVIHGNGDLGDRDETEGGTSGRRPSPEEHLRAWARHQAIGPVDRGSLVLFAPTSRP